jgi:hypothetical protein
MQGDEAVAGAPWINGIEEVWDDTRDAESTRC